MASAYHCLLLFLLTARLCHWGEAAASLSSSYSIIDVAMVERHELWMARYGRVYRNSGEKERRFEIFRENIKYIEAFNQAGEHSYSLGVNEFADLTNEEFLAARTGLGYPKRAAVEAARSLKLEVEDAAPVPLSADWRIYGAISPVKNQGSCGSCWAFSAVAAMESLIKIKGGNLYNLSVQELVDCDEYDTGCDGGYKDTAYDFVIGNGGLTTESNYPYTGADGTCQAAKLAQSVATITGYVNVPENSEPALTAAVARQPVAVSIDARGPDFQFYSSGVFNGSCGTTHNHGVTVIGYGTTDTAKYWLVKNSWGANWGEEGYIRMEKDVADPKGLCGIAMLPTYPIL